MSDTAKDVREKTEKSFLSKTEDTFDTFIDNAIATLTALIVGGAAVFVVGVGIWYLGGMIWGLLSFVLYSISNYATSS